MSGLHGPKVALVEGGHLGFVEALDERHDAGIDDAESQVRIATLKLATAGKIRSGRRLDAVDPGEQVVEEDEPRRGPESAGTPVLELRKNEGGDDQILDRIGQQRAQRS